MQMQMRDTPREIADSLFNDLTATLRTGVATGAFAGLIPPHSKITLREIRYWAHATMRSPANLLALFARGSAPRKAAKKGVTQNYTTVLRERDVDNMLRAVASFKTTWGAPLTTEERASTANRDRFATRLQAAIFWLYRAWHETKNAERFVRRAYGVILDRMRLVGDGDDPTVPYEMLTSCAEMEGRRSFATIRAVHAGLAELMVKQAKEAVHEMHDARRRCIDLVGGSPFIDSHPSADEAIAFADDFYGSVLRDVKAVFEAERANEEQKAAPRGCSDDDDGVSRPRVHSEPWFVFVQMLPDTLTKARVVCEFVRDDRGELRCDFGTSISCDPRMLGSSAH